MLSKRSHPAKKTRRADFEVGNMVHPQARSSPVYICLFPTYAAMTTVDQFKVYFTKTEEVHSKIAGRESFVRVYERCGSVR